jgi:hypothetical protein
MNTACKTLASAAALCLLSACAMTPEMATIDPGSTIIQDEDYIAAVEDGAHDAPVRVRVIWVKPPDRREDE